MDGFSTSRLKSLQSPKKENCKEGWMMKAVVKYASGPGNVEIRDVPEPFPGPDEVKIEVKAAGICGSDLHIYDGDIKLLMRFPVVIGHEFSGVITQVGSSVSKLEPGESAFAKYCVVPSRLVHRLPNNVSFVGGALCEPLMCSVNGVIEKTAISPGDIVVVAGPGTIGLLSLQLVKAEGGFVILCGTSADKSRLVLGKKLGADMTIDVEDENPRETVSEMTKGEGCDVFLECSGSPSAVRMGLNLVRRGGQYTQLGLAGHLFELDFDLVAYKELTVKGMLGQRWTAWKRGMELLEKGLVKTEDLVSDILPLTKWQEGFEKMRRREGIKIILDPQE
jgi:L-iditol 2-dehydrogenase